MEHEIRKHLHNVISEIKNREVSVWNRVAKITGEMLIIIFAVSFAVFMERQREHRHEQQEAREFLLGLRTDLQNDIVEMTNDRKGYTVYGGWLRYLGQESKLDKDSLLRYRNSVGNFIELLVNKGRYEGFKASGKMNTIENTELRNNILDLYEETLVGLTNATRSYTESKKIFQRLIFQKRKHWGKPDDNFAEVLDNVEVRNYCMSLSFTGEIVGRYDKAIDKSKQIIRLIENEYGSGNDNR